MANITQMDAAFRKYTEDLSGHLPDGLIQVNLPLLQRLKLLDFSSDSIEGASKITSHFHVIESPEKITLFNDRFAVWIIPEMTANRPTTYALVAFNEGDDLRLELGFSADGIYNTSRMVLRVLEQLLNEIQETEEELLKMTN